MAPSPPSTRATSANGNSPRSRCWNRSTTSTSAQPAMAGSRRRASSSRSEEHTSELQSPCNLVCRLLLVKKRHASQSDLHAEVTLAHHHRVSHLEATAALQAVLRHAAIDDHRHAQWYASQVLLTLDGILR